MMSDTEYKKILLRFLKEEHLLNEFFKEQKRYYELIKNNLLANSYPWKNIDTIIKEILVEDNRKAKPFHWFFNTSRTKRNIDFWECMNIKFEKYYKNIINELYVRKSNA